MNYYLNYYYLLLIIWSYARVYAWFLLNFIGTITFFNFLRFYMRMCMINVIDLLRNFGKNFPSLFLINRETTLMYSFKCERKEENISKRLLQLLNNYEMKIEARKLWRHNKVCFRTTKIWHITCSWFQLRFWISYPNKFAHSHVYFYQ